MINYFPMKYISKGGEKASRFITIILRRKAEQNHQGGAMEVNTDEKKSLLARSPDLKWHAPTMTFTWKLFY